MSGLGRLLGLKSYPHFSVIKITQEDMRSYSHHNQYLLLIDSQHEQSFQTPQSEMKQLHPKVEEQWTVPNTTTGGNRNRSNKV